MKLRTHIGIITFIVTGIIISYSFVPVKKVPEVNLQTLTGKSINSLDITNDGKPIIIALWAVWCPHCSEELNALDEYYSDLKDETGVKIVAISIDDSRTANSVNAYINGMGWDYEVYLDLNGDLKRGLNITTLPYIALLDSNKNIVYERFSYFNGDENLLIDKLRAL